MNETQINASSRDKVIGGILLAIGLIWILAIAYFTYQQYTSVLNNKTLGQAVIGGLLNALIPLLLVTSGQYYISGKNAKRLAKKGKYPQTAITTPPTPAETSLVQPTTTLSQQQTVQPANPQSATENQTPKQF